MYFNKHCEATRKVSWLNPKARSVRFAQDDRDTDKRCGLQQQKTKNE